MQDARNNPEKYPTSPDSRAFSPKQESIIRDAEETHKECDDSICTHFEQYAKKKYLGSSFRFNQNKKESESKPREWQKGRQAGKEIIGGMKKLDNAKEVMEAFLAGHRLIWKGYGDDETGQMYLYLDESGCIAEEDGGGVKPHRLDFCWRGEDPEWRILELP